MGDSWAKKFRIGGRVNFFLQRKAFPPYSFPSTHSFLARHGESRPIPGNPRKAPDTVNTVVAAKSTRLGREGKVHVAAWYRALRPTRKVNKEVHRVCM